MRIALLVGTLVAPWLLPSGPIHAAEIKVMISGRLLGRL